MFTRLSNTFAAHSGRITRLVALALGVYMLVLHAVYYSNPAFVWSATAQMPSIIRSFLDPNFWFQILTTAGYVAALWTSGALFDTLNEKVPFQVKSIIALKYIGIFLILGAMAAMLKFDLTLNDVKRSAGFTAGFTLNDHDIPIAVIGCAFFLIAYQAKRLRTRLDQFV